MKIINHVDYAQTIIKAIPRGILVTTKASKINSMVIGWGTYGTEWSKPMFVVYVRRGRFTREQLDVNPEFTVNIPLDKIDVNITKVCGTKSGRDIDKVKVADLTLVDSKIISVPGVKELPLTLECKVVYRQEQDLQLLNNKFLKFYPQDVSGDYYLENMDAHVAYYGEIVNAYIAE